MQMNGPLETILTLRHHLGKLIRFFWSIKLCTIEIYRGLTPNDAFDNREERPAKKNSKKGMFNSIFCPQAT